MNDHDDDQGQAQRDAAIEAGEITEDQALASTPVAHGAVPELSKADGESIARLTGPVKATPAQVRDVAAAIDAELRRSLKSVADRLTPANRKLLSAIAVDAAKVHLAFRIESSKAEPSDASLRRIARETKQVDAQLKRIKAVAAKVSEDAFWTLVERVVVRLIQFGL